MTGKRDEQLGVYELTETPLSGGIVEDAWALLNTVWAARKTPNLKRALENGQDNIEGIVFFYFLYDDCPTLNKKMKIIDSANNEYRITGYTLNDDRPVMFTVAASSQI